MRKKKPATATSSGTKKVKKKPVRSWIKKMLDKMKANREKRKLNRARKDELKEREPNTERIDNPRETILDKASEAAEAVIKDKVNVINKSEGEQIDPAKEEKTFIQKYGSILFILAIVIILIIIYFVTKKKN